MLNSGVSGAHRMLEPLQPSAVQQADIIAAVRFGFHHIPARRRNGGNDEITVARIMMHILFPDVVRNPRVHDRPPDVIRRHADIQDREQGSRRDHPADPENDGSRMTAEDKRVEDMDDIPGDPFLGERACSLGSIRVEQVREYMNGDADQAPEGNMT
ncbi:hypothetical protein D3C73_1088540 [compost metagenome]